MHIQADSKNITKLQKICDESINVKLARILLAPILLIFINSFMTEAPVSYRNQSIALQINGLISI